MKLSSPERKKKSKKLEAHVKFSGSCFRATGVGQTTVRMCVTLFKKIALSTGYRQKQ